MKKVFFLLILTTVCLVASEYEQVMWQDTSPHIEECSDSFLFADLEAVSGFTTVGFYQRAEMDSCLEIKLNLIEALIDEMVMDGYVKKSEVEVINQKIKKFSKMKRKFDKKLELYVLETEVTLPLKYSYFNSYKTGGFFIRDKNNQFRKFLIDWAGDDVKLKKGLGTLGWVSATLMILSLLGFVFKKIKSSSAR